MNKRLLGLGSILILCLSITGLVRADDLDKISLTDLVKNRAENAKGFAQSSHSTDSIPEYSEVEKQKIESHLNSLQVGEQIDQFKSEGARLRNEQAKNNPDGAMATMVEASDLKRVKGFEGYADLEMFKEGDKYMQDPISQMTLLKDQGCKEQSNNQKRGFIRKEKKEIITDEIEEFRSCEAPINRFKCSKTLEVSCKKTSECDMGGIERGSVASDMRFDYGGGVLTIGTISDNYWGGHCAIYDRTTTFKISNKE